MSSLIKSTGIIAISTLASRILGFIRDMLFANFFGATGVTDAFWIAFRIPNMLRRFVAEGALTISFIPVYSEYLIKKGEKNALQLAQETLSLLIFTLIGIISLGLIFSPEIVNFMALGIKDKNILSLATNLNIIMFPYLFFISMVAFSMGILNSHNYFFAPAFSPVLLNVFIIIGIIFISQFFEQPLYGVAIGVIIGGIMQFILQIPYLIKTGFKFKIKFNFKHPGVKKISKLLLPSLASAGIYQINIVVITILSSLLAQGSITYLYYCNRLTEMVLGIFIISIGNVILPKMSKLSSIDEFNTVKDLFITAINASLFLAIPAAFALIAIGYPILTLLFVRGKFSPADAKITYNALIFASIGISSIAILRIITPTFYSIKDAKTPLYASGVNFVLNLIFGIILMNTELKLAGLTLALSISSTVQIIILLVVLKNKFNDLNFKKLFSSGLKFIFSSMVMAGLIYYLGLKVDWINDNMFLKIISMIGIIFTGGITYFIVCYILGVEEIKFFINKIKILKQ
jgi:putative peptidoglycan lipid II flippase